MKAIPTDVLSKELMEREGVISITVKEFEKIRSSWSSSRWPRGYFD